MARIDIRLNIDLIDNQDDVNRDTAFCTFRELLRDQAQAAYPAATIALWTTVSDTRIAATGFDDDRAVAFAVFRMQIALLQEPDRWLVRWDSDLRRVIALTRTHGLDALLSGDHPDISTLVAALNDHLAQYPEDCDTVTASLPYLYRIVPDQHNAFPCILFGTEETCRDRYRAAYSDYDEPSATIQYIGDAVAAALNA